MPFFVRSIKNSSSSRASIRDRIKSNLDALALQLVLIIFHIFYNTNFFLSLSLLKPNDKSKYCFYHLEFEISLDFSPTDELSNDRIENYLFIYKKIRIYFFLSYLLIYLLFLSIFTGIRKWWRCLMVFFANQRSFG